MKRTKPAAKEMAKVVIVVPRLPCADPTAPLIVPFRMLEMSDIVVFKVVSSHVVSCREWPLRSNSRWKVVRNIVIDTY